MKKEFQMTSEDFLEIANKESGVDYGLCPPPIKAEKRLDILIDHLLGKDWFVVLPMSKEQTYTVAICEILERSNRKSLFKRLCNW